MKRYSALVKAFGESRIIRDVLFTSKASFIKALRAAGYQVNPAKVKESWLFDFIMQQPVYNDELWKLRKIPTSFEAGVQP